MLDARYRQMRSSRLESRSHKENAKSGFDQSPEPRRASRAERGVLPVRRCADGTKRNAEIGLSAKPGGF
jgi:hypothetical protein